MKFTALITALLWATTAPAQDSPPEAQGFGAELDYVTTFLPDLNVKSIREVAEYCGYIGITAGGDYVRSPHVKGEEATCTLPRWPRKFTVIASYHTHSSYSPNYDSEVPSDLDFRSDEANEIDGYIATPGGRLWFLDSDTMVARQICGIGCLPMDEDFIAGDWGDVKKSYSYDAIVARLGGEQTY